MPGGGSEVSAQATGPWKPARAPLRENINTAWDLSKQPMPYYPGDTTAGMSADTAAAYDQVRRLAGQNLGLDLTPTVTGLATGAGDFWATPQGQQVAQALAPALGGNAFATPGLAAGPGATGVQGLLAASGGGRSYGAIGDWAWGGSPEGAAMTQGLLATAGGQYLDPASNPTWANYSNAAADAVERATTQRYLGAGQTLDTPAVGQTFARDFASVMAPYASNMYEAERGRQMAAQGQIGSLLQAGSALNEQGYQNEAQRRLAASSGLVDLGASGTGQALQAAGLMGSLHGQDTQAQLSALGLAPSMAQLSYLPSSVLEGAGKAQEAYTQADMADQLLRYQYGQMEPWQRVQLLNQALLPALGFGTTQATQAGGGGAGMLAGGALGGAASGAMAGSVFGPWGTAIGGGLGALGGVLASRR